jgi:hypothetical protein
VSVDRQQLLDELVQAARRLDVEVRFAQAVRQRRPLVDQHRARPARR